MNQTASTHNSRFALPMLAWGVAVVAVLGFAAWFTTHSASTQRERIAAATRELAKLSARVEREMTANNRLAQDLAAAKADLDKLMKNEASTMIRQQREVSAWLKRVERLRALAGERPSQRIPEMQFLVDTDWLKACQSCSLESEESIRAAFGMLRNAAKDRALIKVRAALRAYEKEHEGKLPDTIAALVPYLEVGVDPSVLSRYAIIPADAAGHTIAERQPVDADFDSRIVIGSNGSGSMAPPPLAWVDQAAVHRAYSVFKNEHDGAEPPNVAAVLPYIQPLSPERRAQLLEAARVLGR